MNIKIHKHGLRRSFPMRGVVIGGITPFSGDELEPWFIGHKMDGRASIENKIEFS